MEQEAGGMSHDDLMSALFAHMVVQQSNLAMMLLGKVPHPQTGQTVLDLEAAKLFIDQLEMLELKTRGNLSKEEEQLLKQSLMTLRMAFVEAANAQPAPPAPGDRQAAPAPQKTERAVEEPSAASADAESKKKFSKKY